MLETGAVAVSVAALRTGVVGSREAAGCARCVVLGAGDAEWAGLLASATKALVTVGGCNAVLGDTCPCA
jgi:hypothetical protein